VEENRLHEFYCTVLGIVVELVSLINSLGGAQRKLSNKRSSILLWKKYDIVVSLNSKNGTKVAKLPRDFDVPRKTLAKVLKNKDKIISHCYNFSLTKITKEFLTNKNKDKIIYYQSIRENTT